MNFTTTPFTSRRAFTLIELLIVVAIIAILAAIAVPNFLEAQVRAKVARAKADMRSTATAFEAYAVDHNKYPPVFFVTTYMPVRGQGPSVFGLPGAGPSGYTVSPRMIPLTTPIAYITSIFPEPFAVQGVSASGAISGDDPDYYDTYDYINAVEFLPDGPFGPGMTRGSGLTSGGAWRISSVGPDRIQSYGGVSEAQGAAHPANIDGAPYDPTNGTVSSGDLVRIGPGAPGEEPFYDRTGEYAE